ncbi:MAG: hypothetical protein ACYCW6_19550 [Candidatus Xenobia bacterium]
MPIDAALQQAQSADAKDSKRGTNFRARNGATVEHMVDKGWTVRSIAKTEFARRGFEFSSLGPEGHVNVMGPKDRFEQFALELEGASSPLSREELLA